MGPVVAWTFLTAIAVAGGVFFAVWSLLNAQGLKAEPKLSSSTLFDLVKLSFGVVAGAGALVALVVAYRRQRVDEDGALREDTRLHTERFTAAVSQLGAESVAVRLGGVHALAGLADDAPTRELRQTCIDVLCAYLRLPYTAETDLPQGDADAHHAYLALREVRHTVIRLIRDHLCLTPDHPDSWQGHDLDFTGVVFDGGDFDRATFSGGRISFIGAEFLGGQVSFGLARFSGGTVVFADAEFSGGQVNFGGAEFSGGQVSFDGAKFSGSTVLFGAATFSRSRVTFGDAEFSGGTVFFGGAEFSGGTVLFGGAKFSGSTVLFGGATFSGGQIFFGGAEFSGGTVFFGGATFSGGQVSFGDAEFSGSRILFGDAEFSGGTVDFSAAVGAMPSGGLATSDNPRPAGLILPQAWLTPTP
ncbi:pentapeptide repeat-containing protein [Streptomyces sp. NBC_00134]|uniref:pentapeptide repeat-containing protein n=1 Tax=Streptomyces sp. NBC_00134 TaxID=2975663 RepID=UPI002F91843B